MSAKWALLAAVMPKCEKVAIAEAERSIVLGEASDLGVSASEVLLNVGVSWKTSNSFPRRMDLKRCSSEQTKRRRSMNYCSRSLTRANCGNLS